MDVDKMEICMSPDHLLRHAGSPLLQVRLSSHAPKSRQTKPGDKGHEFSDWLLLAELNCQLWIDPKFKDGFYRHLKRIRTVNPAVSAWVSTYGHAFVPVNDFVKCLKQARCNTLRYKAYGQKRHLESIDRKSDPTERTHPLAHLNEWDIGITYTSPNVVLFKPTSSAVKGTSLWPMFTPASQNFGSIQTTMRWQETLYKVKVYPRLVHVIKSFNSRIQGEPLLTLLGAKKRVKACANMAQLLSQVDESELGGFRIEVSVQAPSLDIARQWVNNSPLLDINFWTTATINQDGEMTAGPKLEMLVTTKKGCLFNTNWMLQRASLLNLLIGRDNRRPTKLQRQVVADALASLGWNAGRGRITKSADGSAWWYGQQDQIDPERPAAILNPAVQRRQQPLSLDGPDIQVGIILAHLNNKFKGQSGTKELLKLLRSHHKLKYIPCQKDEAHQYNICGWHPFRMRCKDTKCRHNLNLGNAYNWFATMVAKGDVPKTAITLVDDFEMVENDPRPQPYSSVRQIWPSSRVASNSSRPTTKQVQLEKRARALRFAISLQGPPPPPPMHTRRNVQRSKVNPVMGSNPVAYHTNLILKDGNCMFRAFSIGLGNVLDGPDDLRVAAIRWMGTHSENFLPFIAAGDRGQKHAFKSYLDKMSQEGEWGDNLVLQALCQSYKVKVSILKQRDDSTLIWSHWGDSQWEKCFWLYLSHNHYENLYPEHLLC